MVVNQNFNIPLDSGREFWVDIVNENQEEAKIWYQIAGNFIVDPTINQRYSNSQLDYRINAARQSIERGHSRAPNLQINRIKTKEEVEIEREERRQLQEIERAERERAKQECSDLLTQLEAVMSYEEVDEIENQMLQKLMGNSLSFIHVSPHVDQAKRRIRDHLKQQAQEQAWSELATEIGVENANGIKNGNYYVFQGENKEWFAIGGSGNYLYNLDREQKYCLTVQSITRLPEPDQILAKILWAKNDVESVFDKGNVAGGLTEKLEETKRELVASNRLSVRDLIKNIGKR